MSASVQRVKGKPVAIVMHGFANVEEEPLLHGVLPNNTRITKVVGEDEPDRYTFQIRFPE